MSLPAFKHMDQTSPPPGASLASPSLVRRGPHGPSASSQRGDTNSPTSRPTSGDGPSPQTQMEITGFDLDAPLHSGMEAPRYGASDMPSCSISLRCSTFLDMPAPTAPGDGASTTGDESATAAPLMPPS